MILKGENLMVFVGTGAAARSIAYATNHSLNINLSTTETSNKDQGHGDWQTFEAGVLSWAMSSDNLVGDEDGEGKSYADMVDLMLTKTPVELVFGLEGNSTNFNVGDGKLDEVPEGGWKPSESKIPYYSGKALITSISLNAPNADNASYTVSFQGCGSLKKKTN